MKLTRTLVAGVMEKQHAWILILPNTLDGIITALIGDAMEFSF